MFKPGESGNPGGRPKADNSVRDQARAAGPRLIEFLLKVMESEGESTRDRLTAVNMLLDRGFGKPVQAVQSEDGGPVVMQVQWLPVATPDTKE